MIRHLIRTWVVLDHRLGLSRERAEAAAPEPPPPRHRARTRARVAPRRSPGRRAVRQMSDRLARVDAFALEAEEVYDEVPEQSPRRQLTNLRRVAMRRPDRLVGDAAGDVLNRSFWYDGKMFAALDHEQQVWASGAVPPTVDQALDWVFEQTGTVVPLADFLYADSYARLMADVQRGVYLGIHEAAGVPCHHLSFEQATIDWQIWIDAGTEPLPRKLVITYKTEDEVPQYSVTIRKWNLGAKLPDALFAFTPPDGATRVEVMALGTAWTCRRRTAMRRQLTAIITATALVAASTEGLFAQRRAANRGSVSAASSGSRTRTKEGGTTTVQGERASGSRTVTQTGDGYNVNKQVQTAERCLEERQQGSRCRGSRDRQDVHHHEQVGPIGDA